MSGPNCAALCQDALGDAFKFLRGTPVQTSSTTINAWPTANIALNRACGGFYTNANGGSYFGQTNAGFANSGITGSAATTAPWVINWANAGATAVVDSTILLTYSAVTNLINYGIGLTQAAADFGACAGSAQSFGAPGGLTVPGDCLFGPCENIQPSSLTCRCAADGLLQFIGQICASPSLSYMGQGLSLTVQPPVFNGSSPGASQGACNWQNGPTLNGCGNWSPINFTLGQCAGGCLKTVTLVYINCLTSVSPTYRCNVPTATNTIAVDIFPANWTYANVVFSLADKDAKLVNFKKACFLKVAPVPAEAGCFNVYFGQTRSCNGLQVLVICCLVDLSCLYWQAKVYVITEAKPLFTLPM